MAWRFWNWLWRGQSPGCLGHLAIIVYTRQGCHLCEVAEQQLRIEQQARGFRLDLIDVDSAPELAVRFGATVPVVMIDGKERFRGIVNPVLLRRLLDAEVRRKPSDTV